MDMVWMLKHVGIEPVIVFDGSNLPAKLETAAQRSKTRDS